MVFFGSSPIYNTILFYIILITVILILKPRSMYCYKTKKFKPFGLEKGKTLLCFPIVAITSVVVLYFIFLMVEILNEYLDSSKI